MVRAKAKEVVQRIGAIMRPSQRPNVSGLSVRAAFALESEMYGTLGSNNRACA